MVSLKRLDSECLTCGKILPWWFPGWLHRIRDIWRFRYWPFKKFVPADNKDRAGVYIERTETIWRNPKFEDPDYLPAARILRQVNAYWPARIYWRAWSSPKEYPEFRYWLFHIWNHFDDWKEAEVAHAIRICGLEMEFF